MIAVYNFEKAITIKYNPTNKINFLLRILYNNIGIANISKISKYYA